MAPYSLPSIHSARLISSNRLLFKIQLSFISRFDVLHRKAMRIVLILRYSRPDVQVELRYDCNHKFENESVRTAFHSLCTLNDSTCIIQIASSLAAFAFRRSTICGEKRCGSFSFTITVVQCVGGMWNSQLSVLLASPTVLQRLRNRANAISMNASLRRPLSARQQKEFVIF